MPQIDPVILRLEADLKNYQAGLSQAQRLSDKSFSAIASKALQTGQSIRQGLGGMDIPTDLMALLQDMETVIGRINDSASGRTAREKRATALELVDGTFGRRAHEFQKDYKDAIDNKDTKGAADAQLRLRALEQLKQLAQLEAAFKHQSPLEKLQDELTLTKAASTSGPLP